MADLEKTKGIDLSELSLERLGALLRNELYINIDSPFADELIAEIEKRNTILEPQNG
jgi:hypothetical protein